MQRRVHPGKGCPWGPGIPSHKGAAASEAAQPFPPHSGSPSPSPQGPRTSWTLTSVSTHALALGPRPFPHLGTSAPSAPGPTNTWALGPPEPKGHAGGIQGPALLDWKGGRRRGRGHGGHLYAARAGGAEWRHSAAPRGAGPRIRLFLQLLPPRGHVSEGLGGGAGGVEGEQRGGVAWVSLSLILSVWSAWGWLTLIAVQITHHPLTI